MTKEVNDKVVIDKAKEEIKKLNIYEKLSLITNEIATVAKNLNVPVSSTNSYKAVSERDILDAVKPIENKYRIYSYPSKREIVESDTLIETKDYKGTITEKKSLYMRLNVTYTFINIDKPEEHIEITSYADGIDTGDKSAGKAMTYADKYALMKAYKISTGDDSDKEASPENGYNKGRSAKKPAPVTSENRKQLIDYCNERKLDMNQIAKDYKLNGTSTDEDFKKALDELKKIESENK